MKKIYIAVLLFLAVSLILFVASFFYLDKINHKTFYYTIRSSGKETGTIKVERFVTEDKIVVKSVTSLPFEPVYTEYRSRLVLDKEYKLEGYTKERIAGRASDVLYLENFQNLVSFVSRYQSKFACADNIPTRKDTYLFEEDCPATYLPIIENYDFSKGRSQGFNAISFFQSWSLPSMKRFITLTSIRNEYIKVDSRRIKAENLLLKIRNYPQGAIWVGMSDRSLMKIEIPSRDISIIRTYRPASIKAADRAITPDGYGSKDILFKSKGAELAGTLAYPLKEGRYPAVLLVPGAGPQDRNYQGLFAGLADYLARNGIASLRYDKRGAGSSGGDPASSTSSDEVEDIGSAIRFLSGQDMVDPGKIVLIGHARGAINVMKSAGDNGGVQGLIMMAPSAYPVPDEQARRDEYRKIAKKAKWTDEYLDLVIRTVRETREKVTGSDGDWAYILGKKCFLRDMRDDLAGKPDDIRLSAALPVLILQGKDPDDPTADAAAAIDKMIADSGNTAHTLTYYAYLGQFFGSKTADGVHRYYYETDRDVLENIRNWIDGVLSAPVNTPQQQEVANTQVADSMESPVP
ncbi:MAG: alpha/beta fold hydrolase [Candidatus Omnitrophota bacterium]